MFPGIRGQESACRLLAGQYQQGRLAHAYLFVGPAGVGRRSLALRLAQAYLCPQGGCGECSSCQRVISGSHPDLYLLLEGGRGLKIADIRRLQEQLAYHTYEGHGRVAIVDGAHEFRDVVANALLKTIEEPPPQTLIIFLAEALDGVLPTIRSRCQKVSFRPLSPTLIREILSEQGVSESEAERVIPIAQGSVGKALAQLADTEGLALRERFIQTLAGLSRLSPGEVLSKAGEFSNTREDLSGALEAALIWYRGQLVGERKEFGKRLGKDYSVDKLVASIEVICQAQADLNQAAQPRLAAEALLLRLRSLIPQ